MSETPSNPATPPNPVSPAVPPASGQLPQPVTPSTPQASVPAQPVSGSAQPTSGPTQPPAGPFQPAASTAPDAEAWPIAEADPTVATSSATGGPAVVQSSPALGPLPPQPARQFPSPALLPVQQQHGPKKSAQSWVVACGLGVLLVIAVVQAAVLVNINNDLDAERKQSRQLRERTSELEQTVEAFDGRILHIEGRTAGILNAAEVARLVLPSVFQVEAGDSVGTAFALGDKPDDGGTLLVTNYHVVQAADEAGSRELTITRHDRGYQAELVGTDKGRDLAILHTEKTFPRLRAAGGELNTGAPVVVVGAPLGLSDTVTTGVVSAIRATGEGDAAAIQFDAAISPGNSGGPVVNADGDVVGVATAKVVENDADGIGFAIPVAEVCEKLIEC